MQVGFLYYKRILVPILECLLQQAISTVFQKTIKWENQNSSFLKFEAVPRSVIVLTVGRLLEEEKITHLTQNRITGLK